MAQSQYPALDPNYFINGAAEANKSQGNPADNLFTPGLDLPSPNLATVNLSYQLFWKPNAISFAAGGALVGGAASLPISIYTLGAIAAAGEMSLDALALPLTIGAYSVATGAGVGLVLFGIYEMAIHPPPSPYGPHGPAAPIPFP